MKRLDEKSFEFKVAAISLAFAFIHFVGETIWHIKFGQFLPMLVVDYIAVFLLVYGGIKTLISAKTVGLLCGAWGFEFCLNYRALFWRVEAFLLDAANGNTTIDLSIYLLSATLIISFLMFLMTIYLTNKNSKT